MNTIVNDPFSSIWLFNVSILILNGLGVPTRTRSTSKSCDSDETCLSITVLTKKVNKIQSVRFRVATQKLVYRKNFVYPLNQADFKGKSSWFQEKTKIFVSQPWSEHSIYFMITCLFDWEVHNPRSSINWSRNHQHRW